MVRKLTTKATVHPCQLCTSNSDGGITTVQITTKRKPTIKMTAHKRCLEILPELRGAGTHWRIVPADFGSYKSRFGLKCHVCSELHGAKIQCSASKCSKSFHINCASTSADILFDTEIDTYGLHPWILLCKRHNQEQLRRRPLATPPATCTNSPNMTASPDESVPLTPISMLSHEPLILLTGKDIEVISEFLSTDATWDAILHDAITRC